jgi:vitamin B12 transporter
MTHKFALVSLVGLGLTAASLAHAEETELDEIVISAGRLPVEEEKVGRAYTVITSEELERSQTRYLADALRSVTGLAVSRTGSHGGRTQVRIRGSEANHVLVLIDGVEVAATSSGEFDFGGLQVANIERIEVLRGPQSALYGSNATSGIIHIITKGGERGERNTTVQTEIGSDGTALANLGLSGGNERLDYAFSGAFRRNDGFNISDFGSEKDGDRNLTLNSKVRADITDDLQFDANIRYVNRRSETDDQDFSWPYTSTQGLVIDSDGYTKTREFYAGAGLTWSLLDGQFVQKLRGEYTNLETRGLASSSEYGDDGERLHLGYQGTVFFDTPDFANAKHSLTGAAEWERETYKNAYPTYTSQEGTKERDLYGFAIEYQGEFWDSLFLNSALRYDKNDAFDDAITFSTGLAYVIEETGTRLHSSVGTGVTNPTFFEQFGYIPSMFTGNENLKPEKNFGWDIGVEQKLFDERLTVDVTYFNERLTDEIYTAYAADFTATPANMGGVSKRQGIELSASLAVTDSLQVKATYTYLDATDPDGDIEVRRPKHSGSVNVTQSFQEGRGHFFIDAIFNGEMEDNEYIYSNSIDRVTLDDYVLVNIGADYQLTDTFTVYGRIENLFDVEYEEVYGYNTAGITGFVGMKASF